MKKTEFINYTSGVSSNANAPVGNNRIRRSNSLTALDRLSEQSPHEITWVTRTNSAAHESEQPYDLTKILEGLIITQVTTVENERQRLGYQIVTEGILETILETTKGQEISSAGELTMATRLVGNNLKPADAQTLGDVKDHGQSRFDMIVTNDPEVYKRYRNKHNTDGIALPQQLAHHHKYYPRHVSILSPEGCFCFVGPDAATAEQLEKEGKAIPLVKVMIPAGEAFVDIPCGMVHKFGVPDHAIARVISIHHTDFQQARQEGIDPTNEELFEKVTHVFATKENVIHEMTAHEAMAIREAHITMSSTRQAIMAR